MVNTREAVVGQTLGKLKQMAGILLYLVRFQVVNSHLGIHYHQSNFLIKSVNLGTLLLGENKGQGFFSFFFTIPI